MYFPISSIDTLFEYPQIIEKHYDVILVLFNPDNKNAINKLHINIHNSTIKTNTRHEKYSSQQINKYIQLLEKCIVFMITFVYLDKYNYLIFLISP